MEPYAGFEPRVGEIRAVRTFRIGAGGWLYPLFGTTRWVDGPNTARCRHAPADHELSQDDPQEGPHGTPDAECTCGFYAYGDEAAAGEYAYSRHVLAVVSCWGRVIAGTRGVRAEHARIEGLWMSSAVPAALAAAVRANYPRTQVYPERAALLCECPPTRLDCYELGPSVAPPRWRRVALAGAVLAGALPRHWFAAVPDWPALLVGIAAVLLLRAFVLARRPAVDVASRRRSLFCVALALWLFTPAIGTTGGFLRLPLVQIGGLGLVQQVVLRRAARRFPAHIG